jgi:hypothetical protein
MFNTIVGAGAASRYGSGSDQKMRLLAAPAPQHWYEHNVSYMLLPSNCALNISQSRWSGNFLLETEPELEPKFFCPGSGSDPGM